MNRALGLDRPAALSLLVSPRRVPARVTMRDDRLPHQIRLTFTPGKVQHVAVSCTCRATGHSGAAGPSYRPLESRDRWDDPAEPMRIWRAHMDELEEAADA